MIREFLRDRLAVTGLLIILFLFAVGALAPYIAPDPDAVFGFYPAKRLQPPSLENICGTDQMGRDILSRIIFGARVTIVIAVIAVGIALGIGVPIGLVAGYYESWLGEFLMRIADIFLSIPQFVLALALASALGPSIENAILALSITYWPWFSRLVYAETISTIGMGYTILTAAVLGFLGVGAQPPTPEWGLAISESRIFLPGAWWFATFPGLAIFLVVMAFNMFGDGLRDILDPRLRISGSK